MNAAVCSMIVCLHSYIGKIITQQQQQPFYDRLIQDNPVEPVPDSETH